MSHRHLFIVFFLLFSIHSNSFGQTTNEDIIKIRKEFSRINSDSQLKKLVIEGEDFLDHESDGGASLTGYFSKDKLVKMSFWIGLSFGIRQTDFYYDSCKLIFCFVVERHFQTTDSGLNYNKIEPALEGRYYYKNNTLIQKKLTGSGFWDKEDEASLLPDSKEYSKLLIRKRTNIK